MSKAHETSGNDLHARRRALAAFADVQQGSQPLDQAQGAMYGAIQDLRDRGFARELLLGLLRHHGELDALLAARLSKPLIGKLAGLHHVLMLGVLQLKWLGTPPHAAIDTSVRLARKMGFAQQTGLVNAVLRRISEDTSPHENARLNFPKWMMDSWRQTYGDAGAVALAKAQLAPAPLDITVKAEPALWAEKLGGAVMCGHSIRCEHSAVESLPGYDDGAWWVQDMAASLPVRLLGDVQNKTVIDLCAAPGGKTAQLASAGAKVVAVDRSQPRMNRLRQNMRRLKLEVKTTIADVLEWQPDGAIDAIVLDAPCTATGTIRRHPDMLLHKRKSDVAEMVALQTRMLDRAAGWLKPGGRMVYAVCSLEPQEGEAQIDSFLKRSGQMQLVRADAASLGIVPEWVAAEGWLRLRPDYWQERGGMDGFFMALLEKR